MTLPMAPKAGFNQQRGRCFRFRSDPASATSTPGPQQMSAARSDIAVRPWRTVRRRPLINSTGSVSGRELPRFFLKGVTGSGQIGGAARHARQVLDRVAAICPHARALAAADPVPTRPTAVTAGLSLVTQLPPLTILLVEEYAENRLDARPAETFATSTRQHLRVAHAGTSPTAAASADFLVLDAACRCGAAAVVETAIRPRCRTRTEFRKTKRQ